MKQINIKVGNTPLVELKGLEKKYNLKSKIFAKIESKNPAGSIKDRIAYQMIKDGIDEGKISEDTLLIEATSGNTGIGIAYIANKLGLEVNIIMPSNMSKERIEFIEKYHGKVILSKKEEGMKGAIALANKIHEENPNSIIMSQFENPSNPKAHYLTTGPEIYESLPNVDIFISGVGTGGTISGVGKYLKEKNKNIKVVAVEPLESNVLSGGKPHPHKIQGIGAGFIPKTLNQSIIDEIICVKSEDAYEFVHKVNESDNIKVGISSGANLKAAFELAKIHENKNIVVIFPDGSDRYLSLISY